MSNPHFREGNSPNFRRNDNPFFREGYSSGGTSEFQLAGAAEAEDRVGFIRRTYGHLAGAILAFVALEMLIFGILTTADMRLQMLSAYFSSPVARLLMLGAFIGFNMLAHWWASMDAAPGMHYAALAISVLAWTIMFVPLLTIVVDLVGDPRILPNSAILTTFVFAGLTAGVFITRKDFSFLGGALWIIGFLALGLIVCGIAFGFGLGLWFSVAMVALASAYILYDTSNVLHHYRTDQHVAASLALFSSIAMLLWYIIRIFLFSNRE